MRRGNTHTPTTAIHHACHRPRSSDRGRDGGPGPGGVRDHRGSQARGRTTVAATLLTLALTVSAVTGCTGGDHAPDWTPTPATPVAHSTPTPSLDPAAIKPERPTAMDTFDSAGAEALAVYYMQLVPYGYATGDVTELRELADTECVFCNSVIDGVEKAAAAGQRTTGGVPTIHDVSSLETEVDAWWAVAVELDQGPSQSLDRSGKVIGGSPDAARFQVDLAVTHDGSRWLVREVTPTKVDPVSP